MTSLLPNFSWLVHPSQMNVQKAHQRRQLNVQWIICGRAHRSLTMCQLTLGNAQWRLTRWTSNQLETVLPLNSWAPATITNQSELETMFPLNLWASAMITNQSEWHSTNKKRMQRFFITFGQWKLNAMTKKNLCRSTVAQTQVFNQNLSSQVKRQTVVNN